jgi:ABC-type glycerol-3-phosphate transport system substrate-binding protein
MKQLETEGLLLASPLETTADDSVEMFTTGKLATGIMQNGHTDHWVPQQVKEGKLDKEFALTFVEVPHAAGLKHTVTFGYQAIVVAHRSSSDARNKIVVKLAQVAAGKDYIYNQCVLGGGFSTRVDLDPKEGTAAKPSYSAIAALAKVAGLQDTNPFGARSDEVDGCWKEPWQAFWRGEITAQEALNRFEAAANEVLSR